MNAIPRLQQGGGFESLFTIYKPTQTESPRRTTSQSRRSEPKEEKSNSDKGELTEKDLFDMLEKLDGLPNEMQFMVNNMITTLNNAKALGAGDVQDLATMYLKNLYSLKEAKYNKDQFDNAYKQAVANKSLSEPAIINGFIQAFSKTDRKLHSFNPVQWKQVEKSGEYQIATVGNVLWLRSHSPEYRNANYMLRIAEGSIGIEEVSNRIKSKFQQMGKSETSIEQYIPKEIIKGQQILEQMMSLGPDGYYRYTQELSGTDQAQINATLNYIYSTLDPNSRARLALETKDGTPQSTQLLIKDMILGTLDTKVKHSAQYIGTEDKLSGKSKTGSGLGDLDGTTPAMFLAGLGDKQSFMINAGTSSSFMVETNTLPLTDANDKPLGVQVTLQKVAEGKYSGILDLRSVTMGGQLIDPMAFSKVVVSDGKITSIDFPCENINGVIVPKLSPDTVSRKQKADNEIRSRRINLNDKSQVKANYQIINQIYQNNGLTPAYGADGNPIQGSWARFGVVNGVAGNNALNLDAFSSNPLLQEDDNDYHVQSYMEVTKTTEWDKKDKPSWLEGNADVLYKGTIWIPLRVDYVSAYVGSGISMKEANDLDARTQALNNSNQLTLGRQPQ